jgi:hypothetical protein
MTGWNPWRLLLVSMAVLPFVWRAPASATVYSWKGPDGVLMMSNDPADVPAEARVRQFTSTPAPRPAPDVGAPPDTPGATAAALDAYERGFDAGLQSAERQVALAEEVARIAAVPQAPSAPIVIEQAPPIVPAVGSYSPTPYYSPFGYYSPYSYPFSYPFGVSFVSPRGFAHPRRFGPAFPHGGFTSVRMQGMR